MRNTEDYHHTTQNTSNVGSNDVPSTTLNPPTTTVITCVPIRKSTRGTQPPIWLKYFVSLSLQQENSFYPISNYVSYNHLSTNYSAFITTFSSTTEPQSYTEASKDPGGVEAMKLEIKALQDNHTWDIVSLPE